MWGGGANRARCISRKGKLHLTLTSLKEKLGWCSHLCIVRSAIFSLFHFTAQWQDAKTVKAPHQFTDKAYYAAGGGITFIIAILINGHSPPPQFLQHTNNGTTMHCGTVVENPCFISILMIMKHQEYVQSAFPSSQAMEWGWCLGSACPLWHNLQPSRVQQRDCWTRAPRSQGPPCANSYLSVFATQGIGSCSYWVTLLFALTKESILKVQDRRRGYGGSLKKPRDDRVTCLITNNGCAIWGSGCALTSKEDIKIAHEDQNLFMSGPIHAANLQYFGFIPL